MKIDSMFGKDRVKVDDPIDHAMVKFIDEIDHIMEMKTIAEFVENDDKQDLLIQTVVDYVQGYGLGKPLPLKDLIEPDNYN